MVVASLLISVSALLFTVGSFWWLQARRGPLSCFPVQTFSGYLQADGAALRIPLAVFNIGAVPRVVTSLRLRVQAQGEEEACMPVSTFRRSVYPKPDDVEDFAYPYSVPGRGVTSRHVEFKSRVAPAALLTGHAVTAVVEALIDHEPEWTRLGRFPIHVEVMRHPSNYITYSNQPQTWERGLLKEAAVAQGELRRTLGLPPLL